ncbi:MAG: radical SAM protein [Candidatus Moranbacteria bacterium]|nr:radical SAM protein [Candidatus Moranbacteria bacterium]
MSQPYGPGYFQLGNRTPIGIGAVLNGWNITDAKFRAGTHTIDFCAMTEGCPHNCPHCFTDKKKRTLTLDQIKLILNKVAWSGPKTVNFIGEGEPTLDRDFFDIVGTTHSLGLIPVVFSEGSAHLTDLEFVHRLYGLNASVVLKLDSLQDQAYQDEMVGDEKPGYFEKRNQAFELLKRQGFNAVRNDGTTRLGFDMVVTSRNVREVPAVLRTCREQNVWVIFSFFLPTGRSGRGEVDQSLIVSLEERAWMRHQIREIDAGFGFNHPVFNNFGTAACIERLQILGNGDVTPCPGNDTVIGNLLRQTYSEVLQELSARFPEHLPEACDGHCLYREIS